MDDQALTKANDTGPATDDGTEATTDSGPLPTFADVQQAAARLAGAAHRTPVMTSRMVDERAGATVFFKCENFQRAGAFKFRGAYNALSRLGADERKRGVLTFSSGNHGQAIALAGQLLGIRTVIVMPEDAPTVKRLAVSGYGGEIVAYDRTRENRETIGRSLARQRGLTVIPPFDHPHIIAGQGTAALELVEEVGAIDWLVVPCGGGGLLSGSALTAAARAPGCRVVGVEPVAGDDATRSFRTRRLQTVHDPETIADGARTPSLGRLTFSLVLALVADMLTVDDRALIDAMHFLSERMKLVLEPTGALAVAALLDGAVQARGQRVGVILSGGNVDLADLARWFTARAAATSSER